MHSGENKPQKRYANTAYSKEKQTAQPTPSKKKTKKKKNTIFELVISQALEVPIQNPLKGHKAKEFNAISNYKKGL